MAGETVTSVKVADSQPVAKTQTSRVSYTANGQKGSFNVPVGSRVCTYATERNQGFVEDGDNLVGSGEKVIGHCHKIDTGTDIGKITPVQAKLFDLVRNKDGKPDLTLQDVDGLARLKDFSPAGQFHDYMEKPFQGQCRLGFNIPSFRMEPSYISYEDGSRPTGIVLDIHNLASKKDEGIMVDFPKPVKK